MTDNTLASKTRSMLALTPEQLEARGLPRERAELKSEGTAAGWFVLFMGLAIMVGAGFIAYQIVMKSDGISLMAVLLVMGMFAFGLIVFAVGANLVSRDASPAFAMAGEMILKAIRAIRGGSGGSA
jgi:hypothetical protein